MRKREDAIFLAIFVIAALWVAYLQRFSPFGKLPEYPEAVQSRAHDRGLRSLKALIYQAGIKEEVVLKGRYCTHGAAIQRNSDLMPEIIIDWHALMNHTDKGLEGTLAHELGHLIAGHLDRDWLLDRRRDPEWRQHEANAVALTLVGEDSLRTSLQELNTIHPHSIEIISSERIEWYMDKAKEIHKKTG